MPSTSLVPQIPYPHALLLGLIQGATEFLPVSSTGHMRIIPALLNWDDPGTAFSAVVQLGPIVAIIAYFRKDIGRYLAGIMRTFSRKGPQPENDVDARIGWLTVIGTLPLAIIGLVFEHAIKTRLRWLNIEAYALIILALVMLVAERVGKRNRPMESLALNDVIAIGFAQVLALIPGASRSGTTITAGLFANLDREAAARFSFLLSIPAITLAGVYQLLKTVKGAHLGHALGPYLFATVVAGIVAYAVIAMFLKYLSEDRHSTLPFIVYRILLGIAILILLHTGRLKPDTGLPPDQTSTPPPAAASVDRSPERGIHLASRTFLIEHRTL